MPELVIKGIFNDESTNYEDKYMEVRFIVDEEGYEELSQIYPQNKKIEKHLL